MEIISVKKINEEINKYRKVKNDDNINQSEKRKQAYILLSCYEHYLLENISNKKEYKNYIIVYNNWTGLKEECNSFYSKKNRNTKKQSKKVLANIIEEEWKKYCLLVKKNNNDLSNPQVIEYEQKLLSIINEYLHISYGTFEDVRKRFQQIRDLSKTIESARREINNKIEKAKEDKETKYYIVNIKENWHIEKVYNNLYDDEDLSYTEKKVYENDNSLDFKDCSKSIYRDYVNIIAIKDENGLREVVTGKPLKEWPKYDLLDYPSKNYIYYDTLDRIDEKKAAHIIGTIINNQVDKNIIQEYKKRLDEKQTKYMHEKYDKIIEYNKIEPEMERRALSNVEVLRKYKPNSNK